MTHELPFAESVNYWKTSRTSPDTWMDKVRRQIEKLGGQVLAAGLVDEVRMDVVPVVFGTGKRYFGSVDAQHLLEDPEVLQGNQVLHLRYRVRR